MKIFLDSNIPMDASGGDHVCKQAAKTFLDRVYSREVDGCSSVEVLQELHRYTCLRRPHMVRDAYELFVQTCPDILDVTLRDLNRAKEIVLATRGISGRDAVHAAVMLNHRIE